MKIPFTLEAWLKDKSQKVETRDGRLVHNIWWIKYPLYTNNRKAEVCALIDGEEDALVFFEGGRYLPATKDTDSPFDLFIVTPEPELTSWQTFISGCLQKYGLLDCGAADRIAKECSAELLELARKELEPEVLERLEAAYKNQDEVVYENGKRDGKAEALKDLPRWYKCAPRDIDDDTPPAWIVRFDVEREGNESKIVHNGYYIDFGSLERLPGFNE